MIWTLIEIALIVVTIFCWIMYTKSNKYEDTYEFLAIIFTLSSMALGIFIMFMFIILRSGVNIEIQNKKIEYEGLIKRYEIANSDYEDMSKSDVIKDITEWNRDVSSAKYWSSNLWTNWFWSKKYVDSLQYIELEE